MLAWISKCLLCCRHYGTCEPTIQGYKSVVMDIAELRTRILTYNPNAIVVGRGFNASKLRRMLSEYEKVEVVSTPIKDPGTAKVSVNGKLLKYKKASGVIEAARLHKDISWISKDSNRMAELTEAFSLFFVDYWNAIENGGIEPPIDEAYIIHYLASTILAGEAKKPIKLYKVLYNAIETLATSQSIEPPTNLDSAVTTVLDAFGSVVYHQGIIRSGPIAQRARLILSNRQDVLAASLKNKTLATIKEIYPFYMRMEPNKPVPPEEFYSLLTAFNLDTIDGKTLRKHLQTLCSSNLDKYRKRMDVLKYGELAHDEALLGHYALPPKVTVYLLSIEKNGLEEIHAHKTYSGALEHAKQWLSINAPSLITDIATPADTGGSDKTTTILIPDNEYNIFLVIDKLILNE